MRALQGEPADDPTGARRPRPGRAALPPRRPGHVRDRRPAGGDRKLRVIGSVGDMMALGDETVVQVRVARASCSCRPTSPRRFACRRAPRPTASSASGIAETGPFQHVTAYMPLTIGAAAVRGGPVEDLADRRHRAPPRHADQAHGAGRGRGARAASGRRAPADTRPLAACSSSSAPTSRRAASRSSTPSPGRPAVDTRIGSSSRARSAGTSAAHVVPGRVRRRRNLHRLRAPVAVRRAARPASD